MLVETRNLGTTEMGTCYLQVTDVPLISIGLLQGITFGGNLKLCLLFLI